MIAAGDLLAASPRIAQGLALVVLIGAVALLVRSLFAASRPAPDARATIGRRHELALLGLVLTGAVAMRLAWCRSDLTAPFWFPEAETLHVADTHAGAFDEPGLREWYASDRAKAGF